MTDQLTKGVSEASQSAQENAEGAADKATGSLREQTVGAFTGAARDILGPAIQQMSQQAAEQAAAYAREQGPRIVKEMILPQVMKQVGADTPQDIGKATMGKAGEMMSDAGGLTGMAGKMLSKVKPGGKGGKGGAQATGYGKGRRMPVQQDMFVSLPVEDVYRAWTEFSKWPSYMHRVHGSDPQFTDEEGRVRITEKLWGFSRPFSAQIQEARPNEIIRWKTVEGTALMGTVAFHELGERLTLISVNVDHAPAGMVEKIGRGARFTKRAVRADLHRFKGWVETREQKELDDIEGWLGTIENGKVIESHDDAMEDQENQPQPEQPDPTEVEPDEPEDEEGFDQEEEQEDVDEGQEQQGGEVQERSGGLTGQDGTEGEEDGSEDGQEDEEDDQEVAEELEPEEEEEPEPAPKPAARKRRTQRTRA